jgi:hypothetical protein
MSKRVRTSNARESRARSLGAEIITEWQRAIERSLPANEVFSRCSDKIKAADLTVTQKQELRARNWGCRDLTERTQCVWQLYLDGVRVTRVDAYHDGAWLELTGRMEWRNSGDGYFSSEPPGLLMVRENGVLRFVSPT